MAEARALANGPGSPTGKAVRDAVDRIAASPLFVGSERLSRFLRYVVEETLAGRSQAIKEFSIAVEVYRRPADYDPKIDATVRVEAGRLRSKLRKYYAGEGADEAVRIDLPRGSYVPVFSSKCEEDLAPSLPPVAKEGHTRKAGIVLALVGITAVAAAIWLVNRTAQQRTLLSIAVLPLVSAAGDHDTTRFSLGLADQLRSAIAQGDAFLVAGGTESEQFRNSTQSLTNIAARLHVNAVLEGSVQREPDLLRVTVQLVTPRHDHHIWSQTYQSLPGRLSEFQERVSVLIARTLQARFAGLPESVVGSALSHNAEAMALYQKGNQLWLTQRRPGLEESLVLFGQAVRKDARFARAYEGIAATELFLASLDRDHAADHLSRAKTAAQKGIALDDRLADPHARLGNIFLRREWNFIRAEEELQRSVVLEPGSSPITRWYSEAARLREKYSDARNELEYGLMANPNAEMIETELGLLDFELDQLADAQMHLRRTLASQPGYRLAHLLAGVLYERAGRLAEAESELRTWSNLTQFGQQCLAALGHVYGVQGKTREANEVAHQLESLPNRSMSLAALVYLGMGDRDRTLEALEQAYKERDVFLPLVKLDPRFRPARPDPRYRALMDRLGLPVAIH